jgi:hypothetical protein
MTKGEFIKYLNKYHKEDIKEIVILFMNDTTKLSLNLCAKLVNNLWVCSASEDFGSNMYNLLEASADAKVDFNPKIKTTSCTMYILYPDEHAATFALYKIKQCKIKLNE